MALPKLPASLALHPRAGVVVLFRRAFALLAAQGEELQWFDAPRAEHDDERFNDCGVDAHGRLWVGTIDRHLNRPIGGLYCFDEHGAARKADAGLPLSNGIAWSPDWETLYFCETFNRCVYAYDFDLSRGVVSARRVLIELSAGHGTPDGLAVDAHGGLWVALFGAGAVHRYLPSGALDRTIRLPVSNPTSCTFGGSDLRTLYITTARYGLTDAQLRAEPHAGALFAVRVPEAGVPRPSAACADAWRTASASRASTQSHAPSH